MAKEVYNRSVAALAASILLASSLGFGQNTLSVVRTSPNTIEVTLDNTDDVAGVQFSIRSSFQVVLSDFQRTERISNSEWIVASYQPNDSTMNVVIFGSSRLYFSKGTGSVAKISYRTTGEASLAVNRAALANVMLANPRAESLQVTLQNAEWGSSRSFAGLQNSTIKLGQNFPNPFNPSTRLGYSLTKAGQVRLSVYDITGREVAKLVDGYQFVGDYSVTWNSKDAVGGVLPSGVYFARIQVENEVATMKMILAK